MSGAPLNGTGGRLAAILRGDRLVRNIGWYFLAESCARVCRLVTTVILARMLGPVEMGVAAIAITCFELIRVVANNGIGQMVIRARPEDLDATCNTARRANWVVCGSTAAAHIVVGALVAHFSGRPELFWMIASLSGVYIAMVPGLVPVYLLLRRAAIRQTSIVGVTLVVIDNALVAAMAIAGCGAWSIVLPKLLTAPVWTIMVRKFQRWDAKPEAGHIPLAELLRFAAPVIGSELLAAARINLDKIIVWGVLGLEALGVYYFAFNAGIGFSLSLTAALNNSLYPELARHAGRPLRMLSRFDRALVRTATPIAAVIALQAVMTFLYVPLVFGPRWAHATVLVALLCASAVTKPFFDGACQLLRANGQPLREMAASTLFTLITLGAFALALREGLATGIVVLAFVTVILQAVFARWASMQVAVGLRPVSVPQPTRYLRPAKGGLA